MRLFTLLLFVIILAACSTKQANDSIDGHVLVVKDSILLSNPDSALFLPGYIYTGNQNYYQVNIMPPFTTHVYNKSGLFTGYYLGNQSEDERNRLPFFANALIPVDENKLAYITGAVMHLVMYDTLKQKQLEKLVVDSKGEPIFNQYRVTNDTHIGYFDEGIFILPFDNNKVPQFDIHHYKTETVGIVDTSGTLIRAFGGYAPRYKERLIPYRTLPLLAVDKKNDIIYNAFGADERIYKYDYAGNLLNTFGTKGAKITDHTFPEQPTEDVESWKRNWLSTPVYSSLYFDEKRNLLYRIYAIDTPVDQIQKLGNFLSKDAYLQVYENEKLITEYKLPANCRWTILKIDEEGYLYFASKYFYDKPQDQKTWIYKISIGI